MTIEVAIFNYRMNEARPYILLVQSATITSMGGLVLFGSYTTYRFTTVEKRNEFLMEKKNLDLEIVIGGKLMPDYRANAIANGQMPLPGDMHTEQEEMKQIVDTSDGPDDGCPYCGSYEGNWQECPECGHGQ